MISSKMRALALLPALLLLLISSLALALTSEPAAGTEVAPGDTIAYTYTLPEKMEVCVLRLSLGPGLTLDENSVHLSTSSTPEVIYGSDGFVIMAEALDAGDSITFEAEVSSSALEIWAKLIAGDGSISEEDGYAAHILELPPKAEDTAQLAKAADAPEPDTGKVAVNTTILGVLGGAVILSLSRAHFKRRLARQKQAAADVTPAQTDAGEGLPPDNTVEYLIISEEDAKVN